MEIFNLRFADSFDLFLFLRHVIFLSSWKQVKGSYERGSELGREGGVQPNNTEKEIPPPPPSTVTLEEAGAWTLTQLSAANLEINEKSSHRHTNPPFYFLPLMNSTSSGVKSASRDLGLPSSWLRRATAFFTVKGKSPSLENIGCDQKPS